MKLTRFCIIFVLIAFFPDLLKNMLGHLTEKERVQGMFSCQALSHWTHHLMRAKTRRRVNNYSSTFFTVFNFTIFLG